MADELKDKVVAALKKHQATPKRTRKAATATVQSISGNGNIQAGGDINVNTKKVQRTVVQPGPAQISEQTAFKLSELVKNAVKIECVAGGETAKCFKKWWSKIGRRYKVTSYKMIPREFADDAIAFMQQEVAKLRPKLRRRDNEAWRNSLYKGLWARARQMGMDKPAVYALCAEKIGKTVTSLTALGERDLQKLYGIIISR